MMRENIPRYPASAEWHEAQDGDADGGYTELNYRYSSAAAADAPESPSVTDMRPRVLIRDDDAAAEQIFIPPRKRR
jgi:hypothetical protein